MTNPFELPGTWYKANLHTHTTVSDGRATVAERVAQYRRAGYAVLAITDHRATSDVAGLSDRKMLVVGGMEYHPRCPSSPNIYHLVALNVPHGFAFRDADDAQRCIDEVRAAGGESILAHPAWCGHGFEDFRELKGLAAVEVWNATCDRHGRPTSESEWAVALDHGRRLPAVGTDDAHCRDSDDVCECWTWLRMKKLTVAGVLEAVRSGACYASRGPRIHDFRIAGGKVRVRCSPAASIHFCGGPGQGLRRRAEPGKTIVSFAVGRPARWPYVRAVVTDAAGRKAWTNPIFLG